MQTVFHMVWTWVLHVVSLTFWQHTWQIYILIIMNSPPIWQFNMQIMMCFVVADWSVLKVVSNRSFCTHTCTHMHTHTHTMTHTHTHLHAHTCTWIVLYVFRLWSIKTRCSLKKYSSLLDFLFLHMLITAHGPLHLWWSLFFLFFFLTWCFFCTFYESWLWIGVLFCGFNCTKATTLLNPDEPWFLVQASAIKIWPYNLYHTHACIFFRLSEVMIHGTVLVGQESITAGLQLEVVRWVGAQSFHLQVPLHFFWTHCHSSWQILRWGVVLNYCNRKRMTKWSHPSDVLEAFWNWQL